MTTRRLGLALLLVLTIASALYASTVATRYALTTPATLANGDTWVSGSGVDAALLTYYGTATYTIGRASVLVEPVTTTKAPTAAETKETFTNEGDADGATVTLPTAAAGLIYSFYVQAAQTLTLTAATGDTIRIAGTATAAAGSVTSNTVGSYVTLLAINATEWVAVSSGGTWAF